MSLMYLIAVGLCTLTPALDDSGEQQNFAQLKETSNGTIVAEYEWLVTDVQQLLDHSRSPLGEKIPGPEFYTGQPGYKVRLSLTAGRINPSDGLPYLGIWFSLVQGIFDDVVEWPFQYKLNLTLVDQSQNDLDLQPIHLSLNPMTAICRLLKQFLRPRARRKEGDGCGKALFLPHAKLANDSRYVVNDSLLLRVTIFLEDRGSTPKRAKAVMRGHQLVSEFHWEIEDIDQKVSQAASGELNYITSDLFYVNSESYLMVLQLTVNSEDEHLGLYTTLVPGDFDDTLEWPFSYNFELSIVDQSPGYLTLDRKGTVDPTSGICPLGAFTKPQYQPNVPCGFRKLINFQLLDSRNFKKNGNILIKFTAILDKMPNFASLTVRDNFLVSEYHWRVPNIERKVQLARSGRLSNILSERFYTADQGHLMQLQIKFQNKTKGHIGLYLTLLEGEYDSLLEWPFAKKFQLFVIDQQPSGKGEDIVIPVDPKNPYITTEACSGSFWRPLGRNDACGSSNTIRYDVLYSRKYIRYGAMLVKATIYLEEIQPPRFATLSVSGNNLVVHYEWLVRDIDIQIQKARNEELQFIDSEKFYLSNNGYRMMLRLYPEKTEGFVGLYAVLTKGAYDEELQWPFKYKYQLEVLDQSEGHALVHISRTTYPSTSTSGCPDIAFRKPDLELAEWSCGEGHMISHETLSQRKYKRNGNMRVKIIVYLQEIVMNVASLSFTQGIITADFTWMIERAADKLAYLQSQELGRLESPIFYTSNQGYALRMSLALNRVPPTPLRHHVEDSQKGNFVVGLYLTLYQGQYDAMLRWPFDHAVILTVVDRGYAGMDFTKSIEPDNTKCPSQAFQKPTEAHNEHSCGFAALMPLERLRLYVHGDILLVKTSVVMGNVHKSISQMQ